MPPNVTTHRTTVTLAMLKAVDTVWPGSMVTIGSDDDGDEFIGLSLSLDLEEDTEDDAIITTLPDGTLDAEAVTGADLSQVTALLNAAHREAIKA